MERVAIILSGCGVNDGSEIHESVLLLLALSQQKQTYDCLAPDAVITACNHQTDTEDTQPRQAMDEAARINRGPVISLADADPEAYRAVIFPGGFGVVKNLSNYAQAGATCEINPDLRRFCQAIYQAQKPMGFCCIAPVLANKIQPGITVTIGNDPSTAQSIVQMGGHHTPCAVDQIVIDEAHKVVSTPAYMLGQNPADIQPGIEKLVQAVLERST